jgi:hypothetical protein
MAQPERRYDVTPGNADRSYLASNRRCIGGRVFKRAGSGGWAGTLVRNMAGFAVAIAVLTSCAGGGNIEGSAAPSRSAQLPTPTVSLPTATRSAERPEIPSPTPTKPSPALSSSRPTEEPTDPQEPTSTPSATNNPTRSPIRTETTATTTQTVTAAPSPSTVTRSVTISPSPTASPSPSSSPAGESAETSADSWIWWALAGLLLAAAVATPLLVRAHRRRVWRADFATAEQEVAWFARVLVPELGQSGSIDQVEGGWTVGANRISAVEDRLTVLEGSAPDDATRTGTRVLRDAVRASRGRVEELLQSGDQAAISPTLNEVAAGLEAALASLEQAW